MLLYLSMNQSLHVWENLHGGKGLGNSSTLAPKSWSGSILNQKEYGGLRLRMEGFNRALLAKIGWSLATNQDKARVHMLNAKLVYCASVVLHDVYVFFKIYISVSHFFFNLVFFFSFLICYFTKFNKSYLLYIKIYR